MSTNFEVYAVEHIPTGAVYVGCTSGPSIRRWRQHRYLLRRGQHHARGLQALWDSHSEGDFGLKVLERGTKPYRAYGAELRWMAFYKSRGTLLNAMWVDRLPPTPQRARRVPGGRHPVTVRLDVDQRAQLGSLQMPGEPEAGVLLRGLGVLWVKERGLATTGIPEDMGRPSARKAGG